MDLTKRSYWSVEECCWREGPPVDVDAEQAAVPQQRVFEPAQESVDA